MDNLRKAEKRLAQSRYWDAIQLLENALPTLEGQAEAARAPGPRPRLAQEPQLAEAGGGDPAGASCMTSPRTLEAHFELGQLYKGAGPAQPRRSAMFRKVLEHKPDHEEARKAEAELAFTAPEAPEPESGGGLLKKLFGKKQ